MNKINLGLPIENENGECCVLFRPNEVKIVEKAFKEIERLQEDIGNYVNIVLHDRKEIDRLNNIIKEVRKYIGSKEHYEDDFDTEIEKLYKILDKGEQQ